MEKYDYIDEDKIVAMGGSYGGYMINWIEGHNDDEEFKFKCLVNHDGIFYNLGMFYETDETWFVKAELCPLDNIGCNPFDSEGMREQINTYSPENLVDKWETPMLIIHGNNDYRVSLTQGLSTFTALRLKKVDAKLIFYPLENHWVVSNVTNQVVWLQEIITWFKKYAPPEEEDSSSSSEVESSSDNDSSEIKSSSDSDSSEIESSSDSDSSEIESSSDSSVSGSESRESSSSSNSDSSDSSSSSNDKDGTDALIIVLIILAIIFLLLLVVFFIFRYRKKIKNEDIENDIKKTDLIM